MTDADRIVALEKQVEELKQSVYRLTSATYCDRNPSVHHFPTADGLCSCCNYGTTYIPSFAAHWTA